MALLTSARIWDGTFIAVGSSLDGIDKSNGVLPGENR